MLTINIEEKAKRFLQTKHNIITISRADIERCCVAFEDLGVAFEKPQSSHYEKYEQEGITIYLQKGITFKNNCMDIVLTGIGPFKNIGIDGLKRGV